MILQWTCDVMPEPEQGPGVRPLPRPKWNLGITLTPAVVALDDEDFTRCFGYEWDYLGKELVAAMLTDPDREQRDLP